MKVKETIKKFLEGFNTFVEYLTTHPRIIALAGLGVWCFGLITNNLYLRGFGSGTCLTAMLFTN